MKFITLLALALAVMSCQAMPPAHKLFSLSCDLPTAGGPVTGANLYGANSTDSNWQLLASISGTNGQTVRFQSPPRFELYTADSTNAVDGSASDYSNIFTNSPPAPPSRPK